METKTIAALEIARLTKQVNILKNDIEYTANLEYKLRELKTELEQLKTSPTKTYRGVDISVEPTETCIVYCIKVHENLEFIELDDAKVHIDYMLDN